MLNETDVFISYSSKDFLQVNNIKHVLEKNGITCWMAPQCIPGGSNYAEEIPKAINKCTIFLLMLSDKSQNSSWVAKELSTALTYKKMVLPFMIENCELTDAFNFLLTDVQRYCAFESQSKSLKELVQQICKICDKDNPVLNYELLEKSTREIDGIALNRMSENKTGYKKEIFLVSSVLLVIVGIVIATILNNNSTNDINNIKSEDKVAIETNEATNMLPAIAEAETETEKIAEINEYYIIEYSSEKYLDKSDISGFTYDELQLARNEIFARHGYKFEQEPFKSYFNDQSWYKVSGSFNYESLNAIEKKNVEFLRYEENHYNYDFNIDDVDYVFPSSDSAYLTEEDIENLSLEVLKLGRNEIFARHGYVFKMEVFSEYFSQKDWYIPRETFSNDQLNEYEQYNVTFLKEEENRRSR